MNETSIAQYITETFDGVHPAEVWGYTFFYYNPDRESPDDLYFATLATKDDEYDNLSQLDRPSVYRLNIGISKQTFRSLFGSEPSQHTGDRSADDGYDFTALDRLMPHPVYGRMSWVCVLNPSDETFDEVVKPLLAEAYARVARTYSRRMARKQAQHALPDGGEAPETED
jgi:hypothetical protein